MSRTKKILIWILGLWGLGLLTYNVLAYQHVVPKIPEMTWLGTVSRTIIVTQPRVTPLSGQIIFWSSLILAVLLLVTLLVLSFFPRPRAEVNLKESHGKLSLNKSAVEGLVKTVLREQSFMRNPSVKTKLYRKKVKVDVKGGIIPRYGAAEKAKQIEQLIVDNLREFVGLDYPLKFKVTVTDTETENQVAQEQKTARVI